MGIIQSQSIKGTFFSYLGVIIGFVNLIVITPKILSTNEIGLVQLLISISLIFSQISSLGFNSVTNRLFPVFRNPEKQHNGFSTLMILVGIIGFIISLIIYYTAKSYLIESNAEKSSLLVEYMNLIIPLILFTVFFNLLDNYAKALYNSTLGTALKEFVIRILNFFLLVSYFLVSYDFKYYVYAYVLMQCIPTVYLLLYLIVSKQLSFNLKMLTVDATLRKEIIKISLVGIIGGFSGIAIVNIDKYMINQYLNLSATGIYSIAFYIASLILIPNRSLAKISITLLGENWKTDNISNINEIYQKSSINQTIIALFLFLGIWCNIDSLFDFLPEEFYSGKYVILLIGIGNIINMISGVSMQVISTSAYYRYQSYLMVFLIILVIITNAICIPLFGLTGAALASMISTIIFAIIRMVLIKIKFNMQPFVFNHFKIILLFFLVLFVNEIIPTLKNIYFDIFYRSSLITIIFIGATVFFKISEEINGFFYNSVRRLLSIFNFK